MSGPSLGRPKKDEQEDRKQARQDAFARNAIEGKIRRRQMLLWTGAYSSTPSRNKRNRYCASTARNESRTQASRSLFAAFQTAAKSVSSASMGVNAICSASPK